MAGTDILATLRAAVKPLSPRSARILQAKLHSFTRVPDAWRTALLCDLDGQAAGYPELAPAAWHEVAATAAHPDVWPEWLRADPDHPAACGLLIDIWMQSERYRAETAPT